MEEKNEKDYVVIRETALGVLFVPATKEDVESGRAVRRDSLDPRRPFDEQLKWGV